ncbi:MAG: radical SAM protein [Candidatus Pacearchaeota archaeon]
MNIKYIIKEAKYYRKITGLNRAIKKFLLTQTFFKNLVNSPIYCYYYNKQVRKKSKKIKPLILQIENTNICNAKCIMCPHIFMKRKQKIMKQEDFERIIDNVLKSYKIKRLNLNGFGEPFIDPGLIKKIKYVNKRYPLIKIDIFTNGSLMSKNITDELLKLKVDRITFSINGTKKNYKKIMGLDYENTQNNVLYFLKNNLKKENKILTNISLMILDENKEDIEKFIKFWSPYANSVRAYAPNNWAGGITNIIYKTPFKYNKRWPCIYFWTNITIDVEGNVTLCCRDYESRVIFGNVLKQDIKKIRNSQKFKDSKQKQLNFDFNMPVCSTCDIIFESSIDWIIT